MLKNSLRIFLINGRCRMRSAKVNDIWRHVSEIEKYKTRIVNIAISNLSGFEDINITPQSAITAICGKNGVGKTTLLKFIYNAIKNQKKYLPEDRFGNYDFIINLNYNNNYITLTEKSEHKLDNVYYLEPSQECSRILEYIRKTRNFNEIIEGEGENIAFNDDRVKPEIERIIGKQYKKIVFREITGVIEDDYTFPYFEVELSNDIKYSNVDMGMGEFSVFYILWFIRNCERNSIIFIEEPENFISANTQTYLMDRIAEQANSNKLWVMLSTHSEHILSKISVDNTKVLQKRTSDITHLVEPRYREKYLTALGLTPQLDGVIFVEDNFSAEFLNFLLSKFAPAFLKSHKILPIRCDSNIEKIVLHYEPLRKFSISYIGIFDADQQKKISKYIGKNIYVGALPGKKACPPEVLVWEILVDKLENIASQLQIDLDSIQCSVVHNSTENYHDRYLNISKELNIPIAVLLRAIFDQWVKDEVNSKLSHLFILSLINYNKKHTSRINKVSGDRIYLNIEGEDIYLEKDKVIMPPECSLVIGMNVKFGLYFDSNGFVAEITAG
ncbi:ATP-binding cassette domain-containing protein [Photorhabdus noenieputensis]|nr:ATP-binding cassette domain-containing protein [Photorhabdus noenieputensis]